MVLSLPQSYIVKPFATILKDLPQPCWHWLTGGTFDSATGGTFQSDTDGTFHSDIPGTFESDMGGTFNPLQSNNGDISLENILGNIISMCELAKANRIRPVLCSVLPAAAYRWRPAVRPAEDIVKLNEMIRSYAEENRIPYVDYHSVLKDDQGGLPMEHAADGVHPNLDCYKIMEKIILRYL